MALSYTAHLSDGATIQFDIPFGYLRKQHVFAFVEDELRGFKWLSNSRIELMVAPQPGDAIRFQRLTERATRVTEFTDGQTLLAGDLNAGDLQNFYIMQELIDQITDALLLGDLTVLNPDGGWITAAWIAEQLDAAAPPAALDELADLIAAEELARAAAVVAEANARVNALIAEALARVDADTTLSSSLEAVITRVGASEAAIISTNETSATADSALAVSLAAVVARTTTAESSVATLFTAIANEVTARGEAITIVNAAVGSANANITSVQESLVTEAITRASSVNSLIATSAWLRNDLDGSSWDDIAVIAAWYGSADPAWVVSTATASYPATGGIRVDRTTGGGSLIRNTTTNFAGARYSKVVVDVTCVSPGSSSAGSNYLRVFYVTAGHAESASFYALPRNATALVAGERRLLVYDMDVPTAGGTDWISNTILGIRFDFGSSTNSQHLIHSIKAVSPSSHQQAVNVIKNTAEITNVSNTQVTQNAARASEISILSATSTSLTGITTALGATADALAADSAAQSPNLLPAKWQVFDADTYIGIGFSRCAVSNTGVLNPYTGKVALKVSPLTTPGGTPYIYFGGDVNKVGSNAIPGEVLLEGGYKYLIGIDASYSHGQNPGSYLRAVTINDTDGPNYSGNFDTKTTVEIDLTARGTRNYRFRIEFGGLTAGKEQYAQLWINGLKIIRKTTGATTALPVFPQAPSMHASVARNSVALTDSTGAYAYYGIKVNAGDNSVASIEAMSDTKTALSKLKFKADKIEMEGAVIINGSLYKEAISAGELTKSAFNSVTTLTSTTTSFVTQATIALFVPTSASLVRIDWSLMCSGQGGDVGTNIEVRILRDGVNVSGNVVMLEVSPSDTYMTSGGTAGLASVTVKHRVGGTFASFMVDVAATPNASNVYQLQVRKTVATGILPTSNFKLFGTAYAR